ncbi:ABC transporter ATP-binding protein [Nitratidesulfovibrio liaohensis]|uniref:ABC transporter ATP-binding protein n=1 Tax=Nitratidesulfovibrio liaohensis TaxID=2604158 RepID=UPI00141D8A90|nr:ATP-binding cassette domain-containing protein [Nitratidesulfovibrio liaohensis]NHZ48295.1 ATP-binding cassette domain-containing protein [Nitratidesulfovibrio liaohensis]
MNQTSQPSALQPPAPHIRVRDLTVSYGTFALMRELNFDIRRGDIFIIMGGSGCGKSTLLKVLVGLKQPASGTVHYGGTDFWGGTPAVRDAVMRRAGILYQSGALWSSMTLAENVALPLEQYTRLTRAEIADIVAFKLALVGLAGFERFYPSEISGGMRKRAGLARALALDPEIVFFDEPSAGLDPVSARLLDDLILELRESLGTTIVVVTHELASIFAIGTNSVFLDVETRTMTASGNPNDILREARDPKAVRFLTRGESSMGAARRPGPVTGATPPSGMPPDGQEETGSTDKAGIGPDASPCGKEER